MKNNERRADSSSPVPGAELQDPMERQQAIQFLEQTAALAGVMIIALFLLDLLGLFDDQNLYILLFALGMFMNFLGSLRDYYLSRKVMMWVEAAAACICGGIIFYLMLL